MEQVEYTSMEALLGVAGQDQREWKSEEADASREHTDSLHETTFAWKKGELLGSGSFGSVYLARNETSGDLMAVKEISYAEETPDEIAAIQQEVTLLRSLSHPHIVTYIGSEFNEATSTLYIFTEWVPGGSLEDNTKTFGCSEPVAQNYMSQVLLGVQYLHSRHVIHYDIKPSNILIDQHGTVKLADFGASRLLSASSIAKSKSMRGTPYYMAPEVIKQQTHDTKADIWSIGCTLLKMLTGAPLWKDMKFQTQVALFYHIANLTAPPALPSTLSEVATSFVLACLQIPPDDRWSADQLLRHPFIQQRHIALPPSRHTSNRARASTAAAPSSTTSSSPYNPHHHRTTLTLDLDAPDDEVYQDVGQRHDQAKHDRIPPRVCKTAFAYPDSQSLQLPPAARVHPVVFGGVLEPAVAKSPRPPASDDKEALHAHLPRTATHATAATTSRSSTDESMNGLIPQPRHGQHVSFTPPKTPREEDKLPSLTPPKKKLSDPQVQSIVLEKLGREDDPSGDRRRSLQATALDSDEKARPLTIPDAMPILGATPSPDKNRSARTTSDVEGDNATDRRVARSAFDDTPILTDAAKRERDVVLEREEQKRRLKEQREREWREEQDAYKRSLQR
ncbi:hypothetical protein DYB35_003336 [Aphanomyces astaci]|uniref:Protein kinase domain-containing protein n=1 Tax=Aphanomyces astaci TaxID=112090 RepID=A0A418DUA2_APHAT|nr:hypothetical protein DYB35_003336 [Aphanomyces astaci]